MAKLPRTTQKIFAKNAAAGQVTTFGSIKDGTPVYSTSAGDIMNSNFEDGWSAAVEDDYAPYRQDRNGVDTAVTQQLAYLFQEGIPEYDSGTVYYKGSICKVTDGTGVKIYKSIYDNHSAAVTNTSRWHLILNVDSSNNIVSPSITSPTISGGSMSNGTFSNPTFSGTVNVPLASQSSSTDSTIAASIGWVNNPSLSSNVVHKTGDEIISGNKTFSNIVVKGSSAYVFSIQKSNIQKGTTPESNQEARNYVYDSQGTSGATYSIGGVQVMYNTSGNIETRLRAFKPEASSTVSSSIGIIYPSSGNPYTEAPTPSTSDNSSKIATTAYVKAQGYALDSDVVKTSGNQTIAGTKTFSSTISGSIDGNAATVTNGVYTTGSQTVGGVKTFTSNTYFQSNSPTIILKDANYTKGTASTSHNDSKFYFQDSAGTTYGTILNRVEATNLDSYTRIQTYKQNAGSSASTNFSVNYKANGEYSLTFGVISADSGDVNVSLTKNTTATNDITIPCMGWVINQLAKDGGMASYTKGAKGYYVFTNGLIIQWGVTTVPATDTRIDLLTPFTSKNYSITITSIYAAGIYQRTVDPDSATKTTTSFKTYANGGAASANFYWQAIGY